MMGGRRISSPDFAGDSVSIGNPVRLSKPYPRNYLLQRIYQSSNHHGRKKMNEVKKIPGDHSPIPESAIQQPVSARAEDSSADGPRRGKGQTLRLILLLLVLAVIGAIVLRLSLPKAMVGLAKRQAAKHFAPGSQLEKVDLGVLAGRAGVQGFRLDQPEGFGEELFLEIPAAEVTTQLGSLLSTPLVIERIALRDLRLHLVRNQQGQLNLTRLLRGPETRTTQPSAANEPTSTAPSGTSTEPPPAATDRTSARPIHVKEIVLSNCTIRYTDQSLAQGPLDVTLARLNAVVTDVHLDPARRSEQAMPGHLELTAHLVQPGFADARVGLAARFGGIDPAQPIPTANAVFRLVGLELNPLGSLVPAGVPLVIGGDILDVNFDASLSSDVLDCELGIMTPSGNALSLNLGGTPRQPLVNTDSIRGILAGRLGQAGVNIVKDAGGAGKQLGGAALSTAASAGKGTGKMLKDIVTGVAKAGTSAVKGDLPEAAKNVLGTAAGTVTGAAGTLVGTGVKLAEGVGKSGSTVVGVERSQAWRREVSQRWTKVWDEARELVHKKPYPGAKAQTSTEKQ
jgi:hypothetical protein